MTNKETIYRQDVLDLAKKGVLISNGSYKSVCKAINELPPVNPQEPKTGTWEEDIDNSRRWDKVRFYCSECGKWQTYGKTYYCPSCGARMVEPQERSDKK